MREFLDAILDFIGSESLTDLEFAGIELSEEDYTLEVYEALKAVLDTREPSTVQLIRLKSYFQAHGLEIEEPAYTPKSNILIGGAL